MGIVIKYVCDRCNASQDDPEQMWTVGIAIEHRGGERYLSVGHARHKCLWCRKCCEAVGIIGGLLIAADWEEAKPPTMEDMIRDIVKEVQNEE